MLNININSLFSLNRTERFWEVTSESNHDPVKPADTMGKELSHTQLSAHKMQFNAIYPYMHLFNT